MTTKFQKQRSWYTPKEYTRRIVHKSLPIEMYFMTSKRGSFELKIFRGKAAEPIYYYSFKTEENRNQNAERLFKSVVNGMLEAQKRKHENATQKHTLKEGDILYTSWGYDQTNVEFYCITKVISDFFVELRQIRSRLEAETSMSGKVVATTDAFCGQPIRRRAKDKSVKICKVITAWLWDGSPKYTSSYH